MLYVWDDVGVIKQHRANYKCTTCAGRQCAHLKVYTIDCECM